MRTFCLAALLILSVSVAVAQKAGGWTKASVKEQPVIDAADFAITAQQQLLKKAGKQEKLALQKIVAAEQQVVAGMNYKLTLQVKLGDQLQSVEANVWTRAWLKPKDRNQLTSWKLEEKKE
jgi:hypothetical protein